MSDGIHERWSDEKLSQFHAEFVDHRDKEEQKWAEILRAVNDNRKDTSDLVEAWKNIKGFVWVGGVIGHFFKWLASLAVLGALISWFADRWPFK